MRALRAPAGELIKRAFEAAWDVKTTERGLQALWPGRALLGEQSRWDPVRHRDQQHRRVVDSRRTGLGDSSRPCSQVPGPSGGQTT